EGSRKAAARESGMDGGCRRRLQVLPMTGILEGDDCKEGGWWDAGLVDGTLRRRIRADRARNGLRVRKGVPAAEAAGSEKRSRLFAHRPRIGDAVDFPDRRGSARRAEPAHRHRADGPVPRAQMAA